MVRWLEDSVWEALLASGTDAMRLMNGAAGARVERFGDCVLVSVGTSAELEPVVRDLETFCSRVGWLPSAVLGRYLVRSPGVSDVPFVIRGAVPADPVAREDGLGFRLDFGSGYSPGLFPDQRENRRWLRKWKPGRLLNTFSYTCAFSVVGAFLGAETWSVDASKAALERGRQNFALNGIDAASHRFIAEDVPTYLRRLVRRGERFDAIILDPPTFGRGGGGKTFQIERDWGDLVSAARQLLERPGAILLSCNFADWTAGDLRAGCSWPADVEFVEARRPEDFPPGTGAVSVWGLAGTAAGQRRAP